MTKPSDHRRSALTTNAQHESPQTVMYVKPICVCNGQAVATQYPSMAQPADKQCRHGSQDGTNPPSPLVTAGLTTVSSAVPPHHLCWTAADRETGVDQTEAE